MFYSEYQLGEADRHIPKLYPKQMKALCDILKFTVEDLAEWQDG
jgi:hypothetical protein